MQRFELTTHDSPGQATCPPIFYNSILNQTPAQHLGDLLGQPVGLGLPQSPLQLKAEFGVELLAMRREYEPEYGPTAYNQLVGSTRKIIETTISVLTEVMNANRTYARNLKGLLTNLVTKVTALTLGNYLNLLMGEPVLQVSSIVN